MKYNMVKLKELCTVNQGLQIPISKRYKEPGENRYFYITVQFLKDNGENYYIENPPKSVTCTEDEILVVRTGNTGQVITGVAGCFHNNFFKVTPNEKIYFKYLYYALNNKKMHDAMLNAASGTTIPDLKHSSFYDLEIPLPEISIQKKIAKILDNICDKLKLNNEINNNLYEEAVTLYKDKFKGIGQGKKTIGDYIVPKRGKNLLTRDAIHGDTPVVAGGIAPSAYHNQFNTKSPVITISASGANAGYTNLWNIPVWASDCSYIDDSITKNVYFWYIVLKTRQNEIFDAQTGSAQPHIYPQHIAEMSIGELNIAEVKKYNNLVAPLFKMIGENQKENKKLSQLRDALLPKLMNDEIDLDNIEI